MLLTHIDWSKRTGNFLLFLFLLVAMVDPTNVLLHAKDKVFALLFAHAVVCYKPDWRYLPHILVVLGAIVWGFVSAQIQGNLMDSEVAMGSLKSIAPLVLLLYIRHYEFVPASIVPALITTLLLGILYLLATSNPLYEKAIWTFVYKYDNPIMMTRRYFLGYKVFGMYCRALVCMAFALYWAYFHLINQPKQRWGYLLLGLILSFAFLVSGTRATMLLPFALLGLASYERLAESRRTKYLFYPILAIIALLFFALILVLASETGEASNVMKYGHLTSYADLFSTHPEYLLLGQGIGTSFYTIGFNAMTHITEWSYLELLRNYGWASLLLLAVFLRPLVVLYRHRKDRFTQGILITYVAYLFIAGTNPLLLSSTGMVMILSAYSYCEHIAHKATV